MPSPLVKTKTPGIYRRGSRYVVVYRDPRGRQRKRSAATLAEARAVKAAALADIGRGEYRERSSVTFKEYAEEWGTTYTGRTSKGVRPQTLADYRKRLEQDAIPFLGRLRLSEVEPRDVKSLVAHVAKRGVSPNTVRLALAPVRALFATAVEEGLIRSNPTLGVRIGVQLPPTSEEAKAKALAPDELAALLEAIPEPHRLFFRFLAETGLRIGEAVALRVGDVDLGRKRVQVRRRWYRDNFAPPKSKYGRRDVPIARDLARHLWPLVAGRDLDALLFTSEHGRMVDQSNLASRVLKPAARKAGVPWASFHTFRHTAATAFFRGGWNAVQVQLVLGHHSPAFTLGAYVHLLPNELPEPPFEQLAERAAGAADRSGDDVREDPVADLASALP